MFPCPPAPMGGLPAPLCRSRVDLRCWRKTAHVRHRWVRTPALPEVLLPEESLPCSSLDFNQIHDYQCERAHTISYLASTVYDAQCDRIRDRIQGICQHYDVERLKTGVTLPQRTQRGWGLKLPAPSLHAQNAKCSSTPGSRRGRRRAPRGRRRPPRSARTGAAATQFGPPARQCTRPEAH